MIFVRKYRGSLLILYLLLTAQQSFSHSFNIELTSSRPAFVFTDHEKCDLSIQATGFQGKTSCIYTIHPTGSKTSFTDTVQLISKSSSDTVSQRLPIPTLERGHYILTFSAVTEKDTITLHSTIAIVFDPSPQDITSPWGLMYVPMKMPSFIHGQPEDQTARIFSLLGVSWIRYNFWEHMYNIKLDSCNNVDLDVNYAKKQIKAFRNAGMNVMGEIVQTPKILSSQKDSVTSVGDAGPFYSRVKPADFNMWTRYIKQLTNSFRDDINNWEIWNEPESLNNYWSDNADDFVELVKNTSTAIHEGNPTAKIAAAGFIGTSINSKKEIIQRMFDKGIGNYLDLLSLHYTDENSTSFDQWEALLKKHGLSLKIAITEERSIIPLENLKRELPSAKFSHFADQYLSCIPLIQKDWTINPSAVTYSVGAHLIGSKPYLSTQEFQNFKVYYFAGTKDTVAVIKRRIDYSNPAKLFNSLTHVNITFDHLPSSTKVYDQLGRLAQKNSLANDFIIPFEIGTVEERQQFSFAEPCIFIKGSSKISSIVETNMDMTEQPIVAEAENGRFSNDWSITANPHFSSGKYIALWKKEASNNTKYHVDLNFSVPVDGSYQIYFSGNSLTRLKSLSSISPFTWNVDNRENQNANGDGVELYGIEGAPEGLSLLGVINIKAGQHTFGLQVTSPRQTDTYWTLWFDAIVLRKVK